jgi:hypothetical protein
MSAGVKACSGKFWRAHLLMYRKFSAAQERCPPEKTIRQSLFAIRCRFWLGRNIALLFCPPTEVGGCDNKAC